MSGQANTDLIRKLYSAFGAGNIETILNNVAPNAEWINHGPDTIPYAGDFTGRIRAFFQSIGESTTGGKVVSDRMIATDDSVVSLGRFTANVRGSGATIDSPVAHIFRVQNGKVTSWIGFSDTAAIAAAHGGVSRSAGR